MASIAFNHVAIIGTGLIGASLGLAIRATSPDTRIVGFDIGRDSQRMATRAKAVDQFAATMDAAVHDAQLVVIATPVRAIEHVLRELAGSIQSDTLVTDTASTKAQVLAWAGAHLPPNVSFVGGHPMTGRLTTGSPEPLATLFQNTVYCIVPAAQADTNRVQRFVQLVEAIGAAPYFVDADEHDGLVAGISHLPYLASVALMRSIASDRSWREMSTVAAGGFASATQLAAADPLMYTDICLTNRGPILRQLDRYLEQLTAMRRMIERGDESLRDAFTEAQTARDTWINGQTSSDQPEDDLRGPSIFSTGKLGSLLRGRRDREPS